MRAAGQPAHGLPAQHAQATTQACNDTGVQEWVRGDAPAELSRLALFPLRTWPTGGLPALPGLISRGGKGTGKKRRNHAGSEALLGVKEIERAESARHVGRGKENRDTSG